MDDKPFYGMTNDMVSIVLGSLLVIIVMSAFGAFSWAAQPSMPSYSLPYTLDVNYTGVSYHIDYANPQAICLLNGVLYVSTEGSIYVRAATNYRLDVDGFNQFALCNGDKGLAVFYVAREGLFKLPSRGSFDIYGAESIGCVNDLAVVGDKYGGITELNLSRMQGIRIGGGYTTFKSITAIAPLTLNGTFIGAVLYDGKLAIVNNVLKLVGRCNAYKGKVLSMYTVGTRLYTLEENASANSTNTGKSTYIVTYQTSNLYGTCTPIVARAVNATQMQRCGNHTYLLEGNEFKEVKFQLSPYVEENKEEASSEGNSGNESSEHEQLANESMNGSVNGNGSLNNSTNNAVQNQTSQNNMNGESAEQENAFKRKEGKNGKLILIASIIAILAVIIVAVVAWLLGKEEKRELRPARRYAKRKPEKRGHHKKYSFKK